MKLTIHITLAPRLRMCGTTSPLPHMSSGCGAYLSTGATLPLLYGGNNTKYISYLCSLFFLYFLPDQYSVLLKQGRIFFPSSAGLVLLCDDDSPTSVLPFSGTADLRVTVLT